MRHGPIRRMPSRGSRVVVEMEAGGGSWSHHVGKAGHAEIIHSLAAARPPRRSPPAQHQARRELPAAVFILQMLLVQWCYKHVLELSQINCSCVS